MSAGETPSDTHPRSAAMPRHKSLQRLGQVFPQKRPLKHLYQGIQQDQINKLVELQYQQQERILRHQEILQQEEAKQLNIIQQLGGKYHARALPKFSKGRKENRPNITWSFRGEEKRRGGEGVMSLAMVPSSCQVSQVRAVTNIYQPQKKFLLRKTNLKR